ncbi:lipid-A-disaccharide synthase N-terminal domain-containing protein [bacterium]|nr:lipid-A-disaccharide synthase N-terminal domain-containing protein [bacterium]MBU1638718.1 lipid-A-disaccharide synthase N-terminal domain-containing protein [bacterium]MBU1920298.1 lipid-A-disaccharide synthase N-terminal domain-containing protein [bacterium]
MQLGTITLLGYDLDAWLVLGFAAQGLFFMRFIIQWIATERAKRTMIPIAFWYFSMGGAMLLLVYSIHRADPVFILGYLLSMIIYLRNLFIARRKPQSPASD